MINLTKINMKKSRIIKVRNILVPVITEKENDFICLTDMAKAKEGEARAADIIKNWIRILTTLSF
jgi:KilA-N domain